MKRILIVIAFIAVFSVVKAQQQGTGKQDSIYTAVDVDPTFPDGMTYFYKYLMDFTKYPSDAIINGQQGKVYVTFVIEKDGSLTNIKVLRGISPDIDAEAVRVVSRSPNWQPGTQDGKPVRVQYSMAINFKLPKQRDSLRITYATGETLTVYTKVDHVPTPKGGMDAFYRYLGTNIHYPKSAKVNNIQGKVFLSFVVEQDGSLTHVLILRGLSGDIDAEAIRVLSNAPKWNPGMQNGKPVRVQYNVPISFSLTSN